LPPTLLTPADLDEIQMCLGLDNAEIEAPGVSTPPTGAYSPTIGSSRLHHRLELAVFQRSFCGAGSGTLTPKRALRVAHGTGRVRWTSGHSPGCPRTARERRIRTFAALRGEPRGSTKCRPSVEFGLLAGGDPILAHDPFERCTLRIAPRNWSEIERKWSQSGHAPNRCQMAPKRSLVGAPPREGIMKP